MRIESESFSGEGDSLSKFMVIERSSTAEEVLKTIGFDNDVINDEPDLFGTAFARHCINLLSLNELSGVAIVRKKNNSYNLSYILTEISLLEDIRALHTEFQESIEPYGNSIGLDYFHGSLIDEGQDDDFFDDEELVDEYLEEEELDNEDLDDDYFESLIQEMIDLNPENEIDSVLLFVD